MKFLSVRDLRGKSAKIWKELSREKEMDVTKNGRPIAILSSISESYLEEYLTALRQARAIPAVNDLQRKSIEKGTDQLTLKEINQEIKASRKKRPR